MSDSKPYEPVHTQITSLHDLSVLLAESGLTACPLCSHKFHTHTGFYVHGGAMGKVTLSQSRGLVHRAEWAQHIRSYHWGEDLRETFMVAALAAGDTPKGTEFLWEAK